MLQDDISLWEGRLRLLPALRHDDTEGFGTEWLPRIGLVAELLPGLRLKANLEKSYRVPNFQELYLPDLGFIRGNPNLRSEESTDGDVGFQLAFARLGPLRNVSLEGAYFRREIDESIVFLQVSPSLVQPENTGSATIEGFEIGASLDLYGWLRLSANHTYLDTEVDATGTPLPGRADNETNLRIELGPPSRVAQLVVEMQATDKIPVTDTGSTTVPSRTTWDAAVSVDLAKLDVVRERVPFKELRLTVEGFNLTDEFVRSALYLPQPGRSWAVRMAMAW